jgi:hypothetical protein
MEAPVASPDGEGRLTLLGARGASATAHRAVADVGAMGGGLYFEEEGGYLDAGNAPQLSPPSGLSVSLRVSPARLEELLTGELAARRPAPPSAPKDAPFEFQLFAKGDEYFLRMREDYALVGGVRGEGARKPCLRETRADAVRPGRFQEVELRFDGGELSIRVDGLRVELPPRDGEEPVPTTLAATDAPLLVSSPEQGLCYFGGVDELLVRGVAAEASFEIPGAVRVDGPALVRFDGLGELDAAFHDAPVRFVLTPLRGDGASGSATEIRAAGASTEGASAEGEVGPGARTITIERSGAMP